MSALKAVISKAFDLWERFPFVYYVPLSILSALAARLYLGSFPERNASHDSKIAFLGVLLLSAVSPSLALAYVRSLFVKDELLRRGSDLVETMRTAWGAAVDHRMIELLHSVSQWSSKRRSKLPHDIARQTFGECYLQIQIDDLRDGSIHMNTAAFTTVYSRITDALLRDRALPKKGCLFTRFHITGMLPEEFYNGPQIVYEESDTSNPHIICHCWENYPDFETNRVPPGVKVRRFVVVRDHTIRRNPPTGALSSIDELRDEIDLDCKPGKQDFIGINSEIPEVALCLLRKFHLNSGGHKPIRMDAQDTWDLMGRLIERDQFKYYRIAPRSAIPDGLGETESKWIPLFDAYAHDFHAGSREDCRYCCIGEDVWTQIERSAPLRACFKPGHAPEIVLYGDPACRQWFCGLKALYRPFTRDIEVQFINGEEAAGLFKDFTRVFKGHEAPIHTLLAK